MKVLYVAELAGKPGIFAFKKTVKDLKKLYPHDLMIVGGDGATGGNGLGRSHAAYIRKLGADLITLGDSCFLRKDLNESIEDIRYVLRPENISRGAPGISFRIVSLNTCGKKAAVAVLLGQNSMKRLHANNPFTVLPSLLERLRKQTPYIIIDFHAQATAEKKTLFYAADGLCSAVIGSHTRVQTADETVMERGTAVITDVGRTGAKQSAGGCDIASRINEYLTGIPDWSKEAWDCLELQGVYIDIGDDGRALSIERINRTVQN